MVECAGLEIRYTVIPYRGFKSHSFRHKQVRYCLMQCRIFCFLQKNQGFPVSIDLTGSQQKHSLFVLPAMDGVEESQQMPTRNRQGHNTVLWHAVSNSFYPQQLGLTS